jgi:ribokinase
MEKRPRLVVIGSANTDMVVVAPRIPAPGETVLGGRFVTAAGGKGANQAVAAARLGAHVEFVGCVGADPMGQQTLANLRKEGIDTSLVTVDPVTPSGVALIAVDEHGQNAIVVAPGANMRMSPALVEQADSTIADADCVVLQCEVPIETVAAAIRCALGHGKMVILNPAPACTLPAGLLAGVACVTPNEAEATAQTGIVVDDPPAAAAASRALLAQGAASAVVTLGRRGAAWACGDVGGHIGARAVDAVDATAAGDCFTAALAVHLVRTVACGPDGLTPELLSEALGYATAAAAVSVTRLGAQPSLPTDAEVRELMDQRPHEVIVAGVSD